MREGPAGEHRFDAAVRITAPNTGFVGKPALAESKSF
jgi:hypothetical protein